jgi:uncharacterized SAM-binding protein YcdF (DUF218 family)
MARSRAIHQTNRRRRSRTRPKLSLVMVLLLGLPLVGGLGQRVLRNYFEKPQAIVILGGSTHALEREKFAAEFARAHPNLPIVISSGSPKEPTEGVFAEAGVDLDRLNLDYRAVDTVTNFTTIAADLQAQGIHKIYLITSDYHMRRARTIGEIVLGSRGIDLQPVSVPTDRPEESIAKTLRDGGRAVLWVTTGHTGANWHQLASGQ